MTKLADTGTGTVIDQAVRVRQAFVEALVADGKITSPVVQRAFEVVPRHLFVPEGTPLEEAYNVANSVAIKRSADGVVISSTSAPFIQARMLEQGAVGPGMSALEVGSGGYNAALLAEIVGTSGRVVSVDLDPDVINLTRARLAATGYGSRVTVVHVDAEHPVPGLRGPVDVILVTAGAWDISPAWLDQLAEDGRIVVPLRMNGISRSIGFRRVGDHLESTSAEVCGFVPMQGEGAHDERVLALPDMRGNQVRLRFDGAEVPADMNRLNGVLATSRVTAWSGVTIRKGVSFADLQLWFASFLPGFCRFTAEAGTEIAADERGSWFPFGLVRDDSFAYLAVRKTSDGTGAEFGARAYGESADAAAAALVESVQDWDRRARNHIEPTFAYWPTGTAPDFGDDTAVLGKTHGRVAITWPGLQ